MRHIYEQLASKANKNDEQAWMIGRVVLVAAVFVGTAMFMRGTSAELALYACGAFAFAYNVPLYLLLRRGGVRESFAIGFLLDNGTLVIGWWIAVSSLAGQKQTNDLWLILAPMLIIGVARLGWRTGVAYTVAWLSWMGITHYVQYGPGSYDVEQLPIRLAFLGAGSIIAGRLVARLDSEKSQALSLRSESDDIAEIGRLAGSSMDLGSVFEPIAAITRRLIPYAGLAVADVDDEKSRFSIKAKSGADPGIWIGDSRNPMIRAAIKELQETRSPLLLDGDACRLVLSNDIDSPNPNLNKVASVILVPAIANEDLVAVLVAWSAEHSAFNGGHLRIMARVGAHLSGAIANSRLYQRSIELTKVRETSEAKSSLLSAVSHELKTPLTSMIAFTDILLRDRVGNLTEKQKHHLVVLRRNEESLTSLVDDLLDASRIESGRLELDVQPVDLSELVDDVVESLGPLLVDRSQRVVVNFDDDVDVVQADRRRVSQVVRNLLTNASKYSPNDTTIRVTAQRLTSEILISVRDEGIGMSDEDLRGLFSPFFRSNNAEARRQPGTGLGLAITKGIVEAHGGRVELKSALRRGTKVQVFLPLRAEPSSQFRVA